MKKKLLSKITGIPDIEKNKTRFLINLFLKQFEVTDNQKTILDRINIMTSENIHLNSFMYEPLLDMDDFELINLYKDIENFYENDD